MKKLLLVFLAAYLLCFSAMAANVGKVNFTSFDIVNLKVKGDSTATAVVALTLDNQGPKFEVSNIKIEIKIAGQKYATFKTDEKEIVTISKGEHTNHFAVNISLDSHNPFLILNVFKTVERPDIVVDIEMRPALRGGLGIPIKISKKLDDVNFSEQIRSNIVGLTFSPALASVMGRDFVLKGKVSSFELRKINLNPASKDFDISIILGLDIEEIPVLKKPNVSNLKIDLSLDGVQVASASSVECQVLEKFDKEYNIRIKGMIADSYNPCGFMAFLKDKNDWPDVLAKCSVTLNFVGDHTFKFSIPPKK